MFRHLLVPVDFTDGGDAAIRLAHDLALRDAARLTLMHVVETIDQAEADEFAKFYELLVAKATRQLAALAEPLLSAGIEVEQRIVVGKPLAELAREAVEEPIDLVVVRSHRIDLLAGAKSWGTLSYQLSVLCPCPVLLVK